MVGVHISGGVDDVRCCVFWILVVLLVGMVTLGVICWVDLLCCLSWFAYWCYCLIVFEFIRFIVTIKLRELDLVDDCLFFIGCYLLVYFVFPFGVLWVLRWALLVVYWLGFT